MAPDTFVVSSYGYDAISQLTGDGAQGYSYDLNGNRTMDGYDTDPDNRLRTDGTWGDIVNSCG